MTRSTMRFPRSHAPQKGAYGIRTRVTAVRGRRPRPLDECAEPRDRVADRRVSPHTRERRPGRRPPLLRARFRRTIGKPLCSAPAIVRMCARECKGQGDPAFCGPNAEPPMCPKSFAALPLPGESQRTSGDLSLITYGASSGQRSEVEAYLAQSRGAGRDYSRHASRF